MFSPPNYVTLQKLSRSRIFFIIMNQGDWPRESMRCRIQRCSRGGFKMIEFESSLLIAPDVAAAQLIIPLDASTDSASIGTLNTTEIQAGEVLPAATPRPAAAPEAPAEARRHGRQARSAAYPGLRYRRRGGCPGGEACEGRSSRRRLRASRPANHCQRE